MRTGPAAVGDPSRSSRSKQYRTALALALALALAGSLLAVGVGDPAAATGSPVSSMAGTGLSPTSLPAPGGAGQPDSSPVAETTGLVVPDPGTPSSEAGSHHTAGAAPPTAVAASAPASESEQTFAREYPTHAAARQRDDVASSFHWAVIVGVNDYMGRTTSTLGSVSDAQALREALVREGWRGDQILMLTDHEATHDRIVRAIEWLIRSTDERSTVVFSFSGHMKHESGVTALWPADNRFLWAPDLGRMLGAVRSDRMWVSLQGCHAAGLAAPGTEGPNRLVTYASRVEEKAYEDPATGYSVMGYYLFAEGLRHGDQAGNGDGRVTAQEAFAWAAPRATARTYGQQPYGAQRPVLVDGLGGREFPIAVTGAPPPPPAPGPGPSQADGDTGQDPPRLLPVAPNVPKPRATLPEPRVRVPQPRVRLP